jgi:hypothetical protein
MRAIRKLLSLTVALSLVLLGSACGGNEATDPGSEGGSVPAALVGSWNIATASQGEVCDPLSRVCRPAFGGSETYQFSRAGKFTYTRHLESIFGACTETADLYVTGGVSVADTTITLRTTSAVGRTDDGCGHTKEETYEVLPTTYGWIVEPDGHGGTELLLQHDDGTLEGPYQFK